MMTTSSATTRTRSSATLLTTRTTKTRKERRGAMCRSAQGGRGRRGPTSSLDRPREIRPVAARAACPVIPAQTLSARAEQDGGAPRGLPAGYLGGVPAAVAVATCTRPVAASLSHLHEEQVCSGVPSRLLELPPWWADHLLAAARHSAGRAAESWRPRNLSVPRSCVQQLNRTKRRVMCGCDRAVPQTEDGCARSDCWRGPCVCVTAT